jgi:hypothetical protein
VKRPAALAPWGRAPAFLMCGLALLTSCGAGTSPGAQAQAATGAAHSDSLSGSSPSARASGLPTATRHSVGWAEPRRVPLEPSAAEQLEAARTSARALPGLEPRERLLARLWLVEQWFAAEQHSGAAPAERHAAAFGAGETLSALGFHGEAREAFERAVNYADSAALRTLAWLEAGHSARRQCAHRAALAAYERVQVGAAAQSSGSNHAAWARFWAARVETELGESEVAARRLAALAEGDVEPGLRLAAFDELALLAIARGDAEAAAGWIAAARLALGSLAAAHGDEGRRVRRGLAGMRALPELTLLLEACLHGFDDGPAAQMAKSQLRFQTPEED